MNKHPIQPLERDHRGVVRFKKNKIVDDLLKHSCERGFGLNEIACRDYSKDDQRQLAQLIGYSHSGACDLSYMDEETLTVALKMFEQGTSELQARNEYLEAELSELREALREPIARLFCVHPDDLGEPTHEQD